MADYKYNMYFLLDENKNPYPVDLLTWANWIELRKGKPNRHIHDTRINKYDVRISTIFIGLDHGHPLYEPSDKEYKPVLFETMIFWKTNREWDQCLDRYCTYSEALEGHRKTVREVIAEIRRLHNITKKGKA